jgi:hypothetical protein
MRFALRALLMALVLSATAIFCNALLSPVRGETVKIPCVAEYAPLTPSEGIGTDGCGHVWKLILPMNPIDKANAKTAKVDHSMSVAKGDSSECFYWNIETGAYSQIPCPAPGDTLGFIEYEVR